MFWRSDNDPFGSVADGLVVCGVRPNSSGDFIARSGQMFLNGVLSPNHAKNTFTSRFGKRNGFSLLHVLFGPLDLKINSASQIIAKCQVSVLKGTRCNSFTSKLIGTELQT